jgi:purine-binding chemotaxis protein CheW
MGATLGTKDDEEKDLATMPLVVFHLASESFGLRLEEVREVIRVGLITPVPRAPSFVDGVINLRGEVMPVVDLRTRFGLDRVEPTALSRILIATIAGVNTGLVVDAVDEVKTVPLDALGDPPRVTTLGANKYIEKVVRAQSGMIFLLAIQELLSETEEHQLQALQGKKKG